MTPEAVALEVFRVALRLIENKLDSAEDRDAAKRLLADKLKSDRDRVVSAAQAALDKRRAKR